MSRGNVVSWLCDNVSSSKALLLSINPLGSDVNLLWSR